jgi:hypothetical protein
VWSHNTEYDHTIQQSVFPNLPTAEAVAGETNMFVREVVGEEMTIEFLALK